MEEALLVLAMLERFHARSMRSQGTLWSLIKSCLGICIPYERLAEEAQHIDALCRALQTRATATGAPALSDLLGALTAASARSAELHVRLRDRFLKRDQPPLTLNEVRDRAQELDLAMRACRVHLVSMLAARA
jgi:hypothetical protein